VSPICLPATSNARVVYNKNLVLTGWGVDETKDLPAVLQQAQLRILNGDLVCKRNVFFNIFSNYCAIGEGSPIPVDCFGDSGGPLQFYDGSKWTVYGIVSHGYGDLNELTCINTLPSFYANVPYFLKWIQQNAV
jgi:hypothetical protein